MLPLVGVGDLVRVNRYQAMGIVVDVFDDLDKNHPWIRVHFTTGPASGTKQWCKVEGLEIAKDKELVSLNKISDLEILKEKDL